MAKTTPKVNLEILGTSGLKQSGGLILEEFHKRLEGDRGIRVFREMADNDPVIGGFIRAVTSLVRQVPFFVQPSGTTPEHMREAEFLDSVINDMAHTWQDLLSEILWGLLVFGWGYFEKVYKVRRGDTEKNPKFRSAFSDGRIGIRKISLRAQESLDRWEFDDDGGVRGMHQLAHDGGRNFIPIEKSLLFRTETHKNNPQGRSFLRNAFRSWFLLKNIQEIEGIGIERDLAGMVVIRLPAELMSKDATTAQKSLRVDFERLAQQIKRDEREGIVFPAKIDRDGKATGFDIGLMSTGGSRQINVDATIKRYESRIAVSFLSEFLLLGLDRVGSFSLASVKTNLFAVSLGALMDTVVDTFNRFAVPELFRLNGVPRELRPKLKHGDIEKPELGEIGSYIKLLDDTGLLGDRTPELKRWALEQGGLPLSEASEPGSDGVAPAPTESETADPKLEKPEDANEVEKPEAALEIAKTALNGAQVAALLEILASVAEGRLPRATGVSTIIAAFQLPPAQVETIMGTIGRTFKLTPKEGGA